MKLTGWYDGKQKPVRVGVYERDYAYITLYAKWDGNKWCTASTVAKFAAQCVKKSHFSKLPWRGVAK